VAATVNGHELTRDQLDELVEQELTDLAAERATAEANGTEVTVDEIGIYRDALTSWVRLALVEGDLYTTTPTSSNEIGLRLEAAVPLLERTEADGAAYYAQGPNVIGIACMSAIVTSERTNADEALTAIDDGMLFADAAVQFSDEGSQRQNRGVVIGSDGSDCISVDQFPPDLLAGVSDREFGEPSEVMPLDDGWVILMIRPWAEVLPASQDAIISASTPAQIREGKVSVASRFGVWDDGNFQVVAAAAG
jgi:hypothetical protein